MTLCMADECPDLLIIKLSKQGGTVLQKIINTYFLSYLPILSGNNVM